MVDHTNYFKIPRAVIFKIFIIREAVINKERHTAITQSYASTNLHENSVVVSRKNRQGEWLLSAGLGWRTVTAINRVTFYASTQGSFLLIVLSKF